jgi:anaerobic selenocysteine-containing dehydrogenase
MLIGRREIRSNNSWMHNFHRLVKGGDRCTVLVNPADLSERLVKHGDRVQVRSRVGMVELIAEASEDMMPGVVSIPHGWGHDRNGSQGEIAQRHSGVSCNDLTDERLVDELSGNAVLNGVPVELVRT